MKNIKRKSIALLMAIAMIISCTAAVSAAEVEDTSVPADAQVIYPNGEGVARSQRILCDAGGLKYGVQIYSSVYASANTMYMHINSNSEVLVTFWWFNDFNNNNSLAAAYSVPSTNGVGKTFKLGSLSRDGIFGIRVEITNGGSADYVIWQDI